MGSDTRAAVAQLATIPVLASMQFENAGQGTLIEGTSNLGMVFGAGLVMPGTAISAMAQGVASRAQMDVKTTHADGSVKMAVITVARPALAAGEIAAVSIVRSTGQDGETVLDMPSLLDRHEASIVLAGAGRIDLLGALREALADGTASFWRQGVLASEARVEIDLPGSRRIVADVGVFADGRLTLDVQINNDGAMGATGGRSDHNIIVRLDGQNLVQEHLDQGQYQNWHVAVASDDAHGGQGLGSPETGWLNIRHDVAALQAAGAVASYDLSRGVAESLLASYAAMAQAPDWDAPLGTHGVATYMPGTGGRSDIGFTTAPNAAWLISQDPRAAAVALAQAETASVIPWHMWDERGDGWVSTDTDPALWIDHRASVALTQAPDANTGWTLDTAHQPDLSFVPYVLTGERWMLDNLQAQAAWNILVQWPVSRGNDLDLVVRDNQVRGAAWSLRQIDEAAWASPDGSAEQAYFSSASAANWSWLVSQIPAWTAEQGEAHGWLPGNYGTPGALPPWQQDYFASTAIAAARRGNADAMTFLEWQANFLIGRFTHGQEGFAQHDGTAYLIAIADSATGAPYTTWAQIGNATEARGWSNGTGWSHSQGDYPQLALATLAGIASLGGPSASAAAAAYHALMAHSPPFTSDLDLQRDPSFAIEAPVESDGMPRAHPGAPALVVSGDEGANVIMLGVQATWATGMGDDDTLYGGTGVGWLDGGAGNDSFLVHNLQTVLIERVSEGYDTAWFDVSGARMTAHIEKGALLGSATSLYGAETDEALVANPSFASLLHGNGGDDALWGSAWADTMSGGVGDDVLRGGGGADLMIGGSGNDAFVVGDAGARVVETMGEGEDTAWVTVNDWVLSLNVEIARLAAPGAYRLHGSEGSEALVANGGEASELYGHGGDDQLWGSAYADRLIGNDGNDVIRGQGGADTMMGGTGDDQYVVFSDAVVVVETANAGYDVVHFCGLGSLVVGDHVEEARLYVEATGLTGNAGGNLLVGNNAGLASILNGGGGDDTIFGTPAADTLIGGLGRDMIYGGGGADRFIIARSWGFDQLMGFEVGLAKLDFTGSGLAISDLMIVRDGPNTLVACADSVLILYGAANFQETDFLF